MNDEIRSSRLRVSRRRALSIDGSYTEGAQEAIPTDDATFVRGAQVTDGDGYRGVLNVGIQA